MPNDKNHLYTGDDAGKDSRETNKRRTQQGFSRFSTSKSEALNVSNTTSTTPATQIETKPRIGEPINDSYGTVGAITQIIAFNVFGSNYSIMSINDDVTFAFDFIPEGQHIEFTLDMLIDKPIDPRPIITLDPRIVNPPTLPSLTDGLRVILNFIGVADTTSTRFVYVGGSIGSAGAVNFPIDFPEEADRGTVTTTQTIDFTDSTRHSVSMTIGAASVAIDFSNAPANELALSSITVKQDGTGGRAITFVDTVVNESVIIDAFAALSASEQISFVIEWERGVFTAYLKTGNIVGAGNASQWATFVAVQDVDINDKDLLGVANIDMDGAAATIEGVVNLQFFQTAHSINSLSGEMDFQVAATDFFRYIAGGVEIARFTEVSASVYRLDMADHTIDSVKDIRFDDSATFAGVSTQPTIGYDLTGTELRYNAPAGASHTWQFAHVDTMELSTGNLVFSDGFQVRFNPDATNPGVNVGLVVGDPSATNNGDFWYNSSTNKLRTKENGVNLNVIDGAGSQTPWTSDIDADNFDIFDLSNIIFGNTTGVPVAGVSAIWNDADGMLFNVATGDDYTWRVQGVEQVILSVTEFSPNIAGLDLGSPTFPWEEISARGIEFETGGTLTINKNTIVADAGGTTLNVPDTHAFALAINGNDNIIFSEDEIQFQTGRAHKISATNTSLQIISENESDSVEIWNGAARTNPTIDINDNATTWRSETDETSAILLQLIQNHDTPFGGRTIGNIDFMAENSVDSDEIYGRISVSSQDVTSTTEDGLMQLGVMSDGTLVSGIDIEGGTSASTGALIGFFGGTPVPRQTIPVGATLVQVVTALRNLNLGN